MVLFLRCRARIPLELGEILASTGSARGYWIYCHNDHVQLPLSPVFLFFAVTKLQKYLDICNYFQGFMSIDYGYIATKSPYSSVKKPCFSRVLGAFVDTKSPFAGASPPAPPS